ncbi:MAG: nucleoside-triphosphatase [Kiritimatiellia bacterium]
MRVFVHGAVGVGKSTVVRAAMARLGWTRPAGFFTHWNGADRGAATVFIETWTGARRPMARRVDRPVGPGGLPYELDPGFVDFAAAALTGPDPAAPVVVDELGLIELGAAGFAPAVAQAFRGPGPVLAVVQDRARADWRDLLDPERAARWFRVDAAARAALPAAIAACFCG